MNARDDLNEGSERPSPAGELRRETTEVNVEAMEAGPAGVIEREVTVMKRTPEGGDEDAADADLEKRVESATEKALHRAGDALQGAAPTVGRGAEMAVSGTGSVMSAASGVTGTIVGKIAGRVGGWWEAAREGVAELPEEERRACQVHFEAYQIPAGMTFERALPGYTLGYVAAGNPSYRGQRFEEIEPDLRHGFADEAGTDYETFRDFTRYGYERGTNRL